MKKYILLVLLMLMGNCLYANKPIREGNVINGHVLEKGTEANIPYATVLVVETGKGTVTNEEGQFLFKDIKPGKYTLRVQALGYKTQEKKVEVNKEYATVVHFLMVEETFVTDEVVVSANRNEVSRREAPVIVNVIPQFGIK